MGITPAMPSGSSMNIMMEAMPDRSFDVGIAEEHAVTFAAGLAAEGMIPFCTIYCTFLQRAYDQLIHDVALQNLPVIFCVDRAGLVGEDGATHHGVFDISYLRCIPNIIIYAPKDETLLIDAPSFEAMKPSMLKAAGVIRQAVIEKRPIHITHHSDCDGFIAGLLLEKSIIDLIKKYHPT